MSVKILVNPLYLKWEKGGVGVDDYFSLDLDSGNAANHCTSGFIGGKNKKQSVDLFVTPISQDFRLGVRLRPADKLKKKSTTQKPAAGWKF